MTEIDMVLESQWHRRRGSVFAKRAVRRGRLASGD
jgi:hypothetical protein